MKIVNAGERLLPDTNWEDGRTGLRYQGDGNIVLYQRGVATWGAGVSAVPGVLVMQGDGNLVAYDVSNAPYWASGTDGSEGGWLEIGDEVGLRIVAPTPVWVPERTTPPPPIVPPPGERVMRPLVGLVRTIGQSVGDESGPRYVHGCTDFGGVVKYHEDREKSLRQLDIVARYQQFIRVAWRLNGWLWTSSGLTIDPIRDAWFDEAMRGYLQACHERGVRVNLTCADMFNWTERQAEDAIRRLAQIAASVSPTVVVLHEWNEMRGTWPRGESDDNIERARALTRIWQQAYPWGWRGLSDPENQAKSGMEKLSGDPATVALVHNTRWSVADALRRAFNARYENYPGQPIVEGEPTGPNDPAPEGEFTRKVYQPTESPDALCALYTMHLLTGQVSTYFSDPALVSRRPLDETWGFKELPALWRDMGLPQDIGQHAPLPGHRSGALLDVVGSNAQRADGAGPFAVISGGNNWRVKARRSGLASGWRSGGKVWEQRVEAGEVLPESGPTPTVVRIV